VKDLISGGEERVAIQSVTSAWLRKRGSEVKFRGSENWEMRRSESCRDHVIRIRSNRKGFRGHVVKPNGFVINLRVF
jgi:hypothetical protein